MPDLINAPPYYAHGKVECIDALESIASGIENPVYAALTWQIVKYLWRWCLKDNPLQDLKKAQFYLDRLIGKVDRLQAEETRENSAASKHGWVTLPFVKEGEA